MRVRCQDEFLTLSNSSCSGVLHYVKKKKSLQLQYTKYSRNNGMNPIRGKKAFSNASFFLSGETPKI